jgi:DnaJ family protein B protein 4
MAGVTYYDLLKLEKDATMEAIKKQYRKLSLDCHPDRPNGNAVKFKEINEAYEVLSNPEKRREYDFSLNPVNNVFPEQALFEMLFKGGGGMFHQPPMFFHTNNPKPPPPLVVELKLTLDQAFTGCCLPVEIVRTVYDERSKRTETETCYIDVPAGIDNNEVIVIEQKGNVGPDFEVGDVKVVIHVDNPTKMVRQGLDLVYTHTLSLKDALTGFTFDLEYIHGKQLKIQNQEGNIVTPQLKKTIPGMGMKRDNRTGSLIITFNVQFPTELSSEQMETLRTLF